MHTTDTDILNQENHKKKDTKKLQSKGKSWRKKGQNPVNAPSMRRGNLILTKGHKGKKGPTQQFGKWVPWGGKKKRERQKTFPATFPH